MQETLHRPRCALRQPTRRCQRISPFHIVRHVHSHCRGKYPITRLVRTPCSGVRWQLTSKARGPPEGPMGAVEHLQTLCCLGVPPESAMVAAVPGLHEIMPGGSSRIWLCEPGRGLVRSGVAGWPLNPIRCPALRDAPDRLLNPVGQAFPIYQRSCARSHRARCKEGGLGKIHAAGVHTALVPRRRTSRPPELLQRAQFPELCGGGAPFLTESS
jgi:hypothetical protein